jgi:CheY-like chemotaxis protein
MAFHTSASLLIVDDDDDLLDMLRGFCEGSAFKVTTVGSGDSALKTLSHEKFDAIVADLNLPGMNGIELFDVIGKIGVNTPYALMSGSVDQQLLALASQHGVDAVLTKPLEKIRFLDVVNILIQHAKVIPPVIRTY